MQRIWSRWAAIAFVAMLATSGVSSGQGGWSADAHAGAYDATLPYAPTVGNCEYTGTQSAHCDGTVAGVTPVTVSASATSSFLSSGASGSITGTPSGGPNQYATSAYAFTQTSIVASGPVTPTSLIFYYMIQSSGSGSFGAEVDIAQGDASGGYSGIDSDGILVGGINTIYRQFVTPYVPDQLFRAFVDGGVSTANTSGSATLTILGIDAFDAHGASLAGIDDHFIIAGNTALPMGPGTYPVSTVPEPSSVALLATALVGLTGATRGTRRREPRV